MKATINGLRYDTENAVCIGRATSPDAESTTDFSWWEAGLYRTPRAGRFFLAGEGGAMTRFSGAYSGGAGRGSKVIPLDDAEAREWAEEYLAEDEIEAGFPVEEA